MENFLYSPKLSFSSWFPSALSSLSAAPHSPSEYSSTLTSASIKWGFIPASGFETLRSTVTYLDVLGGSHRNLTVAPLVD